jgi:hypothetical protein
MAAAVPPPLDDTEARTVMETRPSTWTSKVIGLVVLALTLTGHDAVAQPRTPVRLSVSTSGEQANGGSHLLGTSRDNRYVLFRSVASNLVANDTNGAEDLFVRDRDVDRNGVFDEPGGAATVRVSSHAGIL